MSTELFNRPASLAPELYQEQLHAEFGHRFAVPQLQEETMNVAPVAPEPSSTYSYVSQGRVNMKAPEGMYADPIPEHVMKQRIEEWRERSDSRQATAELPVSPYGASHTVFEDTTPNEYYSSGTRLHVWEQMYSDPKADEALRKDWGLPRLERVESSLGNIASQPINEENRKIAPLDTTIEPLADIVPIKEPVAQRPVYNENARDRLRPRVLTRHVRRLPHFTHFSRRNSGAHRRVRR